MTVAKAKIENMLEGMPAVIDIEDFMYQLYLLEKIEEGESDIAEGRILSHEQAIERVSKKWQN
jgi:predicted transcriptional regulator